jgi:hypothetical protein
MSGLVGRLSRWTFLAKHRRYIPDVIPALSWTVLLKNLFIHPLSYSRTTVQEQIETQRKVRVLYLQSWLQHLDNTSGM